jgi:peroxiredoxin
MRRSSNPKAPCLAILFVFLVLAAGAQPPKSGERKPASRQAALASKPAAGTQASEPALPAVSVTHLEPSVGLKVSGQWQLETDEGKMVPLASLVPKTGVVVLLFLSPRDPATQAAAERIRKISDEFMKKKVGFLGLSVNRNESLQELKALDDRADWNFPLARDSRQTVVRGLKAKFTPEVMVIQSGVVRYAGPIDDCWYDARQVKRAYLREVLSALIKDGKTPTLDPAAYGGRAIE